MSQTYEDQIDGSTHDENVAMENNKSEYDISKENGVKIWKVLVVFTLLILGGGAVFTLFEHPARNKFINAQLESYEQDKEAITRFLMEFTKQNVTAAEELFFKIQTLANGLQPREEPINYWDWKGSLLFSFTIITTIGYGTYPPLTRFGQLFVVLYALIGFPIAGLTLSSLAERTLYVLTWLSKVGQDKVVDAFNEFDQDGSGFLDKDEFFSAMETLGFSLTHQQMNEVWKKVDEDGQGSVDMEEFRYAVSHLQFDLTEAVGKKNRVKYVLFAIISWLVIGAGVFTALEGWTFNKSFYFSFVTLTTIGLGDVFPDTASGENFLYPFAIIGLGLVAILLSLIEGALISFKPTDILNQSHMDEEEEKIENQN